MVSGSISLRCSRFFSPFLHSTGSLSVSWEYLALPDGAGRFPQGVSDPVVLRILLCITLISCTGLSPSMMELSRTFHYQNKVNVAVLQPRICLNKYGLGYSPFARHYLGNHNCFLFLWVLRCFSSPGSPPLWIICLQHIGFPHSEISGSIHMCWSPELIAAYHVLLRLWEPRHPPYALNYFLLLSIFSFSISTKRLYALLRGNDN